MQHSLFHINSAINYLSPDYIQNKAKYHSGKCVKYLELIAKRDLNAYLLYLNLS
jgi:hypothetical protein